MKYKIGDVVFIKQGEFEDNVNYFIKTDAIIIITGFKRSGHDNEFNYYICDVYLINKRKWEKKQLFLAKAYDGDFIPMSNSFAVKEAIITIFEE